LRANNSLRSFGLVDLPLCLFKEKAMASENFSAQDFESLLKYPRTPHLEGSRLQPGDEGHDHVPYATLDGAYIVVEEKLDAANSGVSFNSAGDLLLQCRGHYLTGGGRERQFNLFKRWGQAHEGALLERLEDRFVMYGEWMHKLHSVYYNALPHYFLEFDVWDRKREIYLSTAARRELLDGLPVLSVPVLYEGTAPKRLKDITSLLRPSLAQFPGWQDEFVSAALKEGVPSERVWELADKSDLSEGLYVKIEKGGETVGRLKWVRPSFTQRIVEGGKHHSEGPYIANTLRAGVDIFAPKLTHDWSTPATTR
jgi:hypothetical protein